MSHRIVFDQIAVSFPSGVMREACGEELFNRLPLYADQMVLLELGGDNNMTTRHPVSRREVTSRRWLGVSVGADSEVIRESCGFAGYCETGDMRWTGERYTSPESYIRRCRAALRCAVTAREAMEAGFSATAVLAVDPASDRARTWADSLSVLEGLVTPQESSNTKAWRFDLLADPRQAALFMSLRHAVDAETHNLITIDGPRFGFSRPLRLAA